ALPICPSSVLAVWIGSKTPLVSPSFRAIGATSPAAPGPPCITATRKGSLPYFLKFSKSVFFLFNASTASYSFLVHPSSHHADGTVVPSRGITCPRHGTLRSPWRG